jgi:hypothetical protein
MKEMSFDINAITGLVSGPITFFWDARPKIDLMIEGGCMRVIHRRGEGRRYTHIFRSICNYVLTRSWRKISLLVNIQTLPGKQIYKYLSVY